MAIKTDGFLILSVLSVTSSPAYHTLSIRPQGADQEDQNSYLFPRESYALPFTTENGTIILPDHWDADSVCVVIEGHGYVTLITQENKQETHELRAGDVILIRSGVTVHTVNRDIKHKFIMVGLTVPLNTPGLQESFVVAGSKLMESYYNAFSDQVLQAAFNIDKDQVRKKFQPRTIRPFVKASELQIKELSSSESISWPLVGGRHSCKPPTQTRCQHRPDVVTPTRTQRRQHGLTQRPSRLTQRRQHNPTPTRTRRQHDPTTTQPCRLYVLNLRRKYVCYFVLLTKVLLFSVCLFFCFGGNGAARSQFLILSLRRGLDIGNGAAISQFSYSQFASGLDADSTEVTIRRLE